MIFESVVEFLKNLDPSIYSALASLTPLGELRAGIPIALASGHRLWEAFWLCTIANMLAIPIAFFFFDKLHNYFIRFQRYERLFERYVARIRKKGDRWVEKYGAPGLILFVAIPIPGSGAYTGCLAAWIFDVNRKHAFISIMVGVAIAGLLVTAIAAGIVKGLF